MKKTLIIFSAGSFRDTLNELVQYYKNQYEVDCRCEFAPAGLLRERIESGEQCDIFISADKKNIDLLSPNIFVQQKRIIAQNKLILTTLKHPRYQGQSSLDLLANRHLRIASSTPICDPCGDYVWQLFDKIEKANFSQGQWLKQHTQSLVGGRNNMPIPAGKIASQYLLENNYCDVFIGYVHYSVKLAQHIQVHVLPDEFNIIANYQAASLVYKRAVIKNGLFVKDQSEHYSRDSQSTTCMESKLFLDFLTQPIAQDCIRQHGFIIPK